MSSTTIDPDYLLPRIEENWRNRSKRMTKINWVLMGLKNTT